MKRVFSGVQPTGHLHLGNYLGALRNWVKLQEDFSCLYSIVDMHAITLWQNPEDLRHSVREALATLIACGVDPEKSVMFQQSSNPHHAEMAWVLGCVARMGWLKRMTQFKEKAGKRQDTSSFGLFSYPVLMAADILLYHSTYVPVGEDQKQHIELARDIAIKFNTDWSCSLLSLPEPLMIEGARRIMSLRDGTKKMSKSDPSAYSRLLLRDDPDTLALKVRKAKTDPDPLPEDITALERRPEARNLVALYAALQEIPLEKALRSVAGCEFHVLKERLVEVLITTLTPIRETIERLLEDTLFLDTLMKEGAEKARALSEPTIREMYTRIGLCHV